MASPGSAPAVPEDTHEHLRIAAVFVIFVASLTGVLLPVAFGRRNDSLVFSLVKQIGSGVVLATGIVHVLPDANTALSDPSLGACCRRASSVPPLLFVPSCKLVCTLRAGWINYPFAYVIATVAAIFVMAFEGSISAIITKHVRAAMPAAPLPDEESNKAQPELTEAQNAKLEAEQSLRIRLIAVAQVGSPP